MNRIECGALDNEEIDVDFNFKLWPCCIYQNQYAEYGKTGDPVIDALPDDWNDLNKYTFDEIMSNNVYTEYLTHKTWNNPKKCSPVCWKFCGNTEDHQGANNYEVKEHSNQKG